MGFGSTAKKVQQMVDIAETLHAKIVDIKSRVEGTQETVDETATRVVAMESELADQRALLEAIANEQGIDLETVEADSADTGDASGDVVDSDSSGGDDNA